MSEDACKAEECEATAQGLNKRVGKILKEKKLYKKNAKTRIKVAEIIANNEKKSLVEIFNIIDS